MKVILIEDQALLRSTLTTVLEQLPEFELAACSDKAGEAEALCAAHGPDLVILDIFTADGNGIPCVARLKERFPQVKVMMLTGVEDARLVRQAQEAGADFFAYKSLSLDELVEMLRSVHKPYRIFPQVGTGEGEGPGFTEMELRILQLLARGRTAREIAAELYLGYGTVRVYISRMYAATGLKTRAQLVACALRSGMITP